MIKKLFLKHTLSTQRLLIRNLKEEDVNKRYLSWLMDTEVNQYLEVRLKQQNLSELKRYVKKMNASNDDLLLGLFDSTNHFHIGNLKMGPINHFHLRAEIGLVIGEKSFWGRGLAVEAIRESCNYGFDQIGLQKISAGYYSGNIRSAHAFQKAGFKNEGKLRCHWKNSEGQNEDQILIGCLREELK